MTKAQTYLLVLGAFLLVGLSFLPTSVVENDAAQGNFSKIAKEADATKHAGSLDEAALADVAIRRKTFVGAQSKQEKATALDSLVQTFIASNRYDSAAAYSAIFAEAYPSEETWLRAGNLYYEAFEFALSEDRAKIMGEQVRQIYGKLLDKNPSLLDLKAKLGMTYMAEAPMKGVTMIREVLEKDPSNKLARMQMALLSMKSNQYDKAVGHLEQLLKQDPANLEAKFYLGVSYFEMGDMEKADKALHEVKEATKDPNVLQTVEQYLGQLHEKEKH